MPFLIIIIAIFAFMYWFINRTVENQHRWGHSFRNLQFSSDEFYNLVTQAIKSREIPDVDISRVTYSEGGMFSANREYLHIVREELIIDVCAAPFGTGFFVSCWWAERPSFMAKVLRKIEALAPFFEKKTYYQIDTMSMYKGAINDCVMEAINQITADKGLRHLSEVEQLLMLRSA